MAIYKTDAVVIGSKNWGEADKMVLLFTKERGLIQAAAFGCRRPRSPLASGMQMFSCIELQLSEGKRVDTVKQCTLKVHYKKLSEDLTVMAYASFVAEFLREFLPEGQPEPQLFAAFLPVLQSFEERNPRITALIAVYQFMEYTGLQLRFEHCVHCNQPINGDAFLSFNAGGVLCSNCQTSEAVIPLAADLRNFIIGIRDYDWQAKSKIKVNTRLLQQAEAILIAYLQSLIGRPMKSLAFIEQLAQ